MSIPNKNSISNTFNENDQVNSYTKNIKEKKEFINPNHELKLKYLVQKTYHMKQDIERVCY